MITMVVTKVAGCSGPEFGPGDHHRHQDFPSYRGCYYDDHQKNLKLLYLRQQWRIDIFPNLAVLVHFTFHMVVCHPILGNGLKEKSF